MERCHVLLFTGISNWPGYFIPGPTLSVASTLSSRKSFLSQNCRRGDPLTSPHLGSASHVRVDFWEVWSPRDEPTFQRSHSSRPGRTTQVSRIFLPMFLLPLLVPCGYYMLAWTGLWMPEEWNYNSRSHPHPSSPFDFKILFLRFPVLHSFLSFLTMLININTLLHPTWKRKDYVQALN